MPVDLSHYLVIAVSSRALFDLEAENEIFEKQGKEAYEQFQLANENVVLKPGPGFPLVQAILKLNSKIKEKRKAEVVIMSRSSPSVALRVMNSIAHYGLDITRAGFCKGAPVSNYLDAFSVTLFLSRNGQDVSTALKSGIAAGLLYANPKVYGETLDEIRIAFDADAVVFSADSERIYQEKGLEAFLHHERTNAHKLLPAGPFAKLLKALSFLQRSEEKGEISIRTALITARNSPAHERVIRTLRAWSVEVDEMFFMGGVSKQKVIQQFNPHIFFDDQSVHCQSASEVAPTAQVLVEAELGFVVPAANLKTSAPLPSISGRTGTKPKRRLVNRRGLVT